MPVVISKSPMQCSDTEIKDFVALILTGDEVNREGLEARVLEANSLFFLQENAVLLGIAALKNPAVGYREAVFNRAAATVAPTVYPHELGWIFVIPSARGRKLSRMLVHAAVDQVKHVPIFATSRTDNPAMHAQLLEANFQKHGGDFPSRRGNHRLTLFIHSPIQQ